MSKAGQIRFPKIQQKKRRRKHSKSVIPQEPGTCYLCTKLNGDYSQKRGLQEHHIFGGANRRLSEEYGLKVKLCIDHHESGKDAAHRNAEVAQILHEDGQAAFEREYPQKDFREIFGKNYRQAPQK